MIQTPSYPPRSRRRPDCVFQSGNYSDKYDSFVVAGPRACHMDQTNNGQPQRVDPTGERLSLPDIVHRIKSLTAQQYLTSIRDNSWSRFEKRLWQRNYYDHVLRNERDYKAVYEHILANPLNWEMEEENPTL